MPGRLWWFIAVAGAVIMLLVLALRSGEPVQPAVDSPAAARRQADSSPPSRPASLPGELPSAGASQAEAKPPKPDDATASVATVEQQLSRGQVERAAAELERLIADRRLPPDAYRLLLRTAQELRDGRRAAALLSAIPLADPQAGRASGLLAAERTMADFRLFDAVERLRAVKRQYPDDYAADQLLARVYEALGLKWEARPHLFGLLQNGTITEAQLISLIDRILPSPQMEVSAKAATLFPKDLRPRLMQAQALASQQQWRAALELTAPITKAHPDYLPAYILEGSLLLELDQLDGLTAWGRRELDGKQQHPDYWNVVGKWSLRRGDPASAARAFGEACRLDPDYREAYTHLAEALDSLGDNAGAGKCWERAERLSKLRQQLNLWGVNRQSAQRTVAVADALRDLGRYWEAQAWLMFARRAPLEPVADLPTRLADNQRSLAASRDRVDPMAQPALAIPVDRYPLPAWDTPKASAELATDGARAKAPQLVDIAEQTGLDFRYQTAPHVTAPGHWIWQSNGGGIAVTDLEPDGWPDLYVTQGGGQPFLEDAVVSDQLFRNLGGRRWIDQTAEARAIGRGFGQGAASGDYNDDGFADLVVANIGAVRLLRNNGDGTYTEVSESVGLQGKSWATSLVLADLDGDRVADLFIGNYCGTDRPFKEPCYNEAAKGDRVCVPATFPPERDRVYRGTGDGRFVDVTDQWLGSTIDGRALGLIAGDLAPSPGLELFVANDMSANQLWLPQRTGDDFQWIEAAGVRGLAVDARGREQACMGVAAGDPDHDGDLDLVVTNFYNEANNFYEQVRPGRFSDKASAWGLAEPSLAMLGFGTQWADLDLDGQLELFVANGHIDDYSFANRQIPFRMPAQLFRAHAERLQLWTADELGPYFERPRLGRSVARLDWDRDGYPELAVGHIDDPMALLALDPAANAQPSSHWLSFELVATDSQRDAIGTTVELKGADGFTRWGQLVAGDGFQCSNQRQLSFGLGAKTGVEEVTIRWPSGREQQFTLPAVDKTYLAIEGRLDLLPR